MGGKKGKKSKKSKTKAQKAAAARHKKFKQTKVQTFGGKRKSFSKSEESRIKKAGYSVKGYSSAAPNKASGYSGTTGVSVGSKIKNPNPKTSGIGPVKSGDQYAKSLSTAKNQPTKKTTGIGPYADGAKYAAALKASPPRFPDGTKVASHDKPLFKSVPARLDQPAGPKYIEGMLQKNINPSTPGDLYGIGTKTAMLGGDDLGSKLGIAIGSGMVGGATFLKNKIQDAAENLRKINEKKMEGLGDQSSLGIGNLISAVNPVANLTNLGIAPAGAVTIKSTDSFGYPSQEAVDKAAGITAGGLNVGGSGFTPSSPSGGSTSRAVRDMTSEQLADRYESSLNPDSFKGLSDGETRGVGPVASGRAYAAGLNVDNKNVENIGRSILSKIPGVNIRRLTDKEIADNRVSAQKKLAYRNEMAKFRGAGGGGGARLPVAPLTPEEILLPEQMAAAQAAPAYQQTLPEQTGVDPNRLLQIQQEAYQQAFNPYNPLTVGGFNPFFRFFNRRGGARRGSFRRAFRRD